MNWTRGQREALAEAARRMLDAAEADDAERRRLRGGVEWLFMEVERSGDNVADLWERLRAVTDG